MRFCGIFNVATTLDQCLCLQVCDLSWLPRKFKFPLHDSPAPVKGKFCFLKPAAVKVVGSFLLGTVTKPNLNVDIAVQIPKVQCYTCS